MPADHPDPTARFSDRVENYVKYRPSYPAEMMAALPGICGLTPASVIADVGSGTGIMTRLLLQTGSRVFGIEPNSAMRGAAETALGGEPNFASRPGSAEATGLPTASVDVIVAAQAFHWFDRARTKTEFRRILRPGGQVLLIWNERETDTSPFLEDYEALLEAHATARVNHTDLSGDILRDFYHPGRFQIISFRNSQNFDFEGLRGRCLSSSYIPPQNHPGHPALISALRELFETHQTGGSVRIDYRTRVYHGRFQ